MNGRSGGVVAMAALVVALGSLYACGGEQAEVVEPKPEPAPAPAPPPEPVKAERPAGPLAALLMSQAQFVQGPDGKPKPGPAKLVLWRTDGQGNWWDEVLEDEGSNVFHKALPWRDGLLTIAAGQIGFDPPKPAQIRHWKLVDGKWTPTTLWEKAWGGRFQRLRDVELGDLNGDGKDEFAIATHDSGVVAVGTEGADGAWTFVEMDEKADTFVHEIEIGDVDGDGKKEFYATPSERNKSSGESQPGGVVKYAWDGKAYAKTDVAHWDISHAKEILVHDVNGDGKDELYVVREGHVVKKGKTTSLQDPVKVLRMDWDGTAWKEVVVSEIEDHQTRFLVPGDVNHDGKKDLVAAGYKSGLWMLELQADGTFKKTLIDANSSGFEHATHVADLDGDGKLEIYVAADEQRELRSYVWTGTEFKRTKIAGIPDKHITWNIQDAKL